MARLGALVGQRVALRVDVGPPGIELFGSALELDEFDQPSLVEVGEASTLVVGGVDLPLEAGELRVEQFVIGRGRAFGDGLFAGEEHLGPQQRVAHLFEDEGVELVGADVAFVAALVLAPGAQRVVVATVVVAVERAVAAAHFVADHADSAGAAADQAAQQPRARVGPARAPLRVVPTDSAGGFEGVVGDDGRHGDLYPVLSGPGHLAAGASGSRVGHGLSLVEIHAAHVGLVAEQPPDGRRPPHRLARGRRYPSRR